MRHKSVGELASVLSDELIREEKNDEKRGFFSGIKGFFKRVEDDDTEEDDDSEGEHENES